jgi:hypothetical protein
MGHYQGYMGHDMTHSHYVKLVIIRFSCITSGECLQLIQWVHIRKVGKSCRGAWPRHSVPSSPLNNAFSRTLYSFCLDWTAASWKLFWLVYVSLCNVDPPLVIRRRLWMSGISPETLLLRTMIRKLVLTDCRSCQTCCLSLGSSQNPPKPAVGGLSRLREGHVSYSPILCKYQNGIV